jgi:tetratricopeptide (TPR) repeat protein
MEPVRRRLLERALAFYEGFLEERGGDPAVRREAGRAHRRVGDIRHLLGQQDRAEQAYRAALGVLEQLVADRPAEPAHRQELARSHHNLGNLLHQAARPREAEGAYGRALALLETLAADFPTVAAYRQELARSHRSLSALLRQAGRVREAIEAARQALKQDPDNPEVQNELAWLLATSAAPKLRDPRQAVELAQKAVARAPQNGAFWNTLGVARYRAGDWPAAVAALEKSMQLQKGGDAADWFFLAMAHWRSGDKGKARRWYDRAVAWAEKNRPKDEELGRIRAEAAALLGLPGPPPAPGNGVPPGE